MEHELVCFEVTKMTSSNKYNIRLNTYHESGVLIANYWLLYKYNIESREERKIHRQ